VQTFFRTKVRQHDHATRPYGSLRISVRREHVFEDSFHQLRSRTPEEMRMKLNVTFQVGVARVHEPVCFALAKTCDGRAVEHMLCMCATLCALVEGAGACTRQGRACAGTRRCHQMPCVLLGS